MVQAPSLKPSGRRCSAPEIDPSILVTQPNKAEAFGLSQSGYWYRLDLHLCSDLDTPHAVARHESAASRIFIATTWRR